ARQPVEVPAGHVPASAAAGGPLTRDLAAGAATGGRPGGTPGCGKRGRNVCERRGKGVEDHCHERQPADSPPGTTHHANLTRRATPRSPVWIRPYVLRREAGSPGFRVYFGEMARGSDRVAASPEGSR